MRKLLDQARISDEAAAEIDRFHSDTVEAVIRAVQSNDVVVVGMAQNPFVKKARKALDDAQIPFTYLEYGSYLSEWKKRLAIKLWSGYPTFPQVFVKGVLVGGCNATKKAIADGSLAAKLK
jgi:glutaredoxin-related protein